MKVIHVTSGYFPHSCGGSEVYIADLVEQLNAMGINSVIAIPSPDWKENYYCYNNISVYQYPIAPKVKTCSFIDNMPQGKFEQFYQWLKAQGESIYHQHTILTNSGIDHLRLAKKLGLKTVMSIHTPNPICPRGTMLLFGNKACDGKLELKRCTQCCGCMKSSKGLMRLVSMMVSCLPVSVSQLMGTEIKWSRINSALGRKYFISRQFKTFEEMCKLADKIIALCQWTYDALLINGVSKEKIVLCRHGVKDAFIQRQAIEFERRNELSIGFIGRWSSLKGIHTLVRAIKQLPANVKVKLTIHGCGYDKSSIRYKNEIFSLAASDLRIQEGQVLSREDLISGISGYDLIAVPSEWMETGPLTVLEAFSAGIPVIGSNIGGIAELVQHGINGWLVPPKDVKAWAKAIAELSTDQELLSKMRLNIKPPASTQTVANAMYRIYESL